MFFEKNLQALQQSGVSPQGLLAKLPTIEAPSASEAAIFTTDEGHYNLMYQEILVHDAFDPIKEAHRGFKSACKSGDNRLHLILGLGLGYALDEAFQNSTGKILVYEPHLPLLRLILENVDLSEMLASPRVQVASNHFELMQCLRPHIYSDVDLDIYALPSAPKLIGADFPELIRKIKNVITDWGRDYMTVKRFHRQWFKQFFENFTTFTTIDSIEQLENRFEGKPALVISRGPSLDNCLEDIRALKDSAVLVAVGGAIRRLWEAGLVPDFAIFYDANGMQEQLNGIPQEVLEKITFVMSPCTSHCCFTQPSRGKFVFVSDNGRHFCEWMDKTFKQKHLRLEGGGTVSLIAMQLAKAMGCNPLILVGQDLALTNNQAYAGGIPATVNKQGEMVLQRTDTLYFTGGTPMAIVRGQNGENLPSLATFDSYIRHFEDLAAREALSPNPRTLYNASIGGAHLEGYTLKALSEFRGQFPVWKENGYALAEAPHLTPEQQKARKQIMLTALGNTRHDLKKAIAMLKELQLGIPKGTPQTETQAVDLEIYLLEATQRLFIFAKDQFFLGHALLFELSPYRQRLNIFLETEGFDISLRDDLMQCLNRSIELFRDNLLPWVEQAERDIQNADKPAGKSKTAIVAAL